MADEADESRAPGWHRDPFGRFYGRYWDGERWTAQVVKENRSLSTDPPDGPTPPGGSPPLADPPVPTPVRAPEATGRTWRRWQVLAGVGVAFLAGVGVGGSGAEKEKTVEATGQASTTQATLSHIQVIPPSTTPAPTPPPTLATTTIATTTTTPGPRTEFSNGTHRVGIDIAPGTYVAPGGSGCYWERQSVFGGSGSEAIIANEFARGGQVVVTIAASDKGFKTSGCGTWRRG